MTELQVFYDFASLKKPLVGFGFRFAFCSVRRRDVEVKVTEFGDFIACVFDRSRKECATCKFKLGEKVL